MRLKGCGSSLGDFISSHSSLSAIEDLQSELLNISACSIIVRYSLVLGILAFELFPIESDQLPGPQAAAEAMRGEGPARLTCSSLSTRSVV